MRLSRARDKGRVIGYTRKCGPSGLVLALDVSSRDRRKRRPEERCDGSPRLTVLERTPPHWRIRVETRSFDCGEHDYHLVFREQNTVEMRITAPGVDSLGYLPVRDDPAGGTLVTYRLLVRPQGLAGWFVSRKELRRKQEDMVVRYFRDVRRLSEATVAAGPPVGG